MDLASLLVLLGINKAADAYQKGKADAIARKYDEDKTKIDAWRAKYTDKAMEERYYAEWAELYRFDTKRTCVEERKISQARKERLMEEISGVSECGYGLWEYEFVRLMLAKHGKILTSDSKHGIIAFTNGCGEGDAKYKKRWEQNHYMQWYAQYLEAHGGPTGMKFFPNASLVRISKTDKTEPPMKDYYELNETDPLLFTLGQFNWLENKSQYQTGYWK